MERLAEIQRRLAGFPLVLHGGSSVAQDEVERICNAAGKLQLTARGLVEAELTQAISLGIAKVNIATDGRLLWTRVHREFFRDHPTEFDFMTPDRIYMTEFAQYVASNCRILDAAGKDDYARQPSPEPTASGSIQERPEQTVAADVRRRNSIVNRKPPPHVGGYAS